MSDLQILKSRSIALVTGGGTGVGRAISKALGSAGYHVIVAGRRADVIEQTVFELATETGGNFDAYATDVGNPVSVKSLFDYIEHKYGRLDLLINNAGTSVPGVPLEDVSFEDWSGIVGANLTGAFLCTQHAFRIMKSQKPRGGRIINNGSISATTPRPNSAPYTATKHAITGLTKSSALDGRPFDIACGQIDIGNAASEMTQKIATGVIQANGTIAAEPTIDPLHVANAVVYMASLPLDANVLTMTVMATKMPLVGRG
ncbi:SDR family oxidoreductase [Brucella sp. NBRC 12950]|uniref:SDR family oxidoreductase n=1 Tax=Brucella sp. NBRC 12950 TaxID=2994518 RepID=UPI0024A5227D|nr:SDR family oxidoreductase [Brucella sp. NBRC 12950]GLU28210.1 oxidoreductase [Brucella sp. NBRC 12950]